MQQYQELLQHVLDNGFKREDRTGVGTIGVFGTQLRFDLRKGFPAVTTKKLAFKSVVSELLWFLEGSTDERRLAEIHYGKPREELVGKNTIWTANADKQGKDLGYQNDDLVKELGPVYGSQWRKWETYPDTPNCIYRSFDQIKWIINRLKTNPNCRRIIMSAWNASEIEYMALPPCHVMSQFNVNDKGELSCLMFQRSVDCFLGLPFNIASYALLTHMLAQVTGLKVGEFIWTGGDTHIYLNHIDAVNEQLKNKPLSLPTIWLNPGINSITDFKMSDVRLDNYKHHQSIKAEMAV